MIDEYWTWQFYGYHSDDLLNGSHKLVVARCNICCKYRVVIMQRYRDLCRSCAQKSRPQATDEACNNMSVAHTGVKRKPHSEETKKLISESNIGEKNHFFGKHHSDEAKLLMSARATNRIATYETRCNMSASHQGLLYEDWKGFVKTKEYCHLFNDALKDVIRAKYNFRCFRCNISQDDNIDKNGRQIKLAVHHVDRNKDQGCDGSKWKLVPLCMRCHPGSHHDPLKSRIEYLLNTEDM